MGEEHHYLVFYKYCQKSKLAFIHWSLSGIDLSCFPRLFESHKNDWSAFVPAFNSTSSQKPAYYVQKNSYYTIMSAGHTANNSNSNNLFEDEKYDISNHSEKNTESNQEKNSVEPNTSPTENIH